MLIFLYLFLNTAIFWVRIQSAGPQWGQGGGLPNFCINSKIRYWACGGPWVGFFAQFLCEKIPPRFR